MSKEQNQVVLCLGSNQDQEQNVRHAAECLRARFGSIRFAPPVYTKSFDSSEAVTFLNQVAILYSPDPADVIRRILKEIECSLGRKPEDKAVGRVLIDIDLICWNELVFKADDLRRDYVMAGIQSLVGKKGNHHASCDIVKIFAL